MKKQKKRKEDDDEQEKMKKEGIVSWERLVNKKKGQLNMDYRINKKNK